ncbi:DNA adenine methylase [Clostridium perfringens]|uniref:DNA adenine methylase n=1 Tax=Clostridium perfringens TaxID=1502 RepID=UPI00263ACA2C|nr:DNA adenine methylase [Clostridium perfringens]ELC8428492.1 DNA adenine methylase [Clostridium perfringens]MDN4737277.1 DNA adenine methylase [Clostridium perfringens]MDN4740145.1 DNA adenine methylase [Clostridium perfringens]
MKSYTPLRYPGGKAKLYLFMKELIEKNFDSKPVYVEPFAGGCGLALKLLQNNIVEKIIINDNDNAIYCFWHSILNNNSKFIQMIENAKFSIDEWNYQKSIYMNQDAHSKLEIGFATFYLNRCNRSGIILAGPIGGQNQDGAYKMDCRFNKDKLINIVKDIYKLKKSIKLHHTDAIKFIKYIDNKYSNLFIYLDPPYVKKGRDLYKNHFNEKDHIRLANGVRKLKNQWFITYDNSELIREIYKELNQEKFVLRYTVAGEKKGEEIAIYKDSLKEKLSVNDYI